MCDDASGENAVFGSKAGGEFCLPDLHGSNAPEVGVAGSRAASGELKVPGTARRPIRDAAGWRERDKVGRMVGGRDDRALPNARVEARRPCVRAVVPE